MYIAYLSSYQSCYKYKLMKKEMLMLTFVSMTVGREWRCRNESGKTSKKRTA